jgi:hypothetical protein
LNAIRKATKTMGRGKIGEQVERGPCSALTRLDKPSKANWEAKWLTTKGVREARLKM